MSTKPSSATANAAPTKQPRSRKAANPDTPTTGRAGSAGGVLLEKHAPAKLSTATPTKAAKPPADDAKDTKDAQPKRKPRKLNKEPTSSAPSTTKEAPSMEAAELEALKSRVRGLEAKVEELYKSAPQTAAATPRSPRRRGKGRKSSSATTTVTLGTLAAAAKDKDSQTTQGQVTELGDTSDADEELIRLETELEHARQDLALYRPNATASSRQRRRPSPTDVVDDDNTEPVEEIPRSSHTRPAPQPDRQVTLSGSYRIPLPATLNPEDVKTIQSGVTAAQNVARSFLDQRRANAALRTAQAEAGAPPTSSSSSSSAAAAAAGSKQAKARTRDSGVDLSAESGVEGAGGRGGGKQSWGEWIGGYSLAISRAVKSIEHEAAMEAQRGEPAVRTGSARNAKTGAAAGGGGGGGTGGAKKKRPGPKTTLSGEQMEGLMG